jgi:cobalamin biosynthesis protein CobT
VDNLDQEISLEEEEDEEKKDSNSQEGDEETHLAKVAEKAEERKDSIINIDDEEDDMEEEDSDQKENASQSRNPGHMMKVNVSKLAVEEKKVEIEYDFEIMDYLFEFLQKDGELYPILCGYFNKIVMSMLQKIRKRVLAYILVRREGEVFNLLLNNLEHHSLAQLMVELLQVKLPNAQGDKGGDSSDKNEE